MCYFTGPDFGCWISNVKGPEPSPRSTLPLRAPRCDSYERERTGAVRERGAVLHAIGKPFLKSCQAGAATTVRCCSMSCTESRLKNGSYHVNCEVKKPSKLACSVQLGRKVVRHAIRVTNRACDDAIADDHFANVLLNGTYGYLN